jgi:hypothetical protein
MSTTNETYTHVMGEETRWAERHNKEVWESREREAKEQEQRMAAARLEWEATPDSERNCTVCGLKLSPVDIGRITMKPTLPRHHEICDPFKIASHVVKGLLRLLKESCYPDEPVPLDALKKLIDVHRSQSGRCYISQIEMSFALEDKPPTPIKRPALVDPLQHGMMENQRQKEWAQSHRHAELHRPVIFFDDEGSLHLVSKTVQKWRDGLTDKEFGDLLQVLHSRLPELAKKQIIDYGTTAMSYVHRRGSY